MFDAGRNGRQGPLRDGRRPCPSWLFRPTVLLGEDGCRAWSCRRERHVEEGREAQSRRVDMTEGDE